MLCLASAPFDDWVRDSRRATVDGRALQGYTTKMDPKTILRRLALAENVPILLTRATLGYGFFLTGSGKIAHPENIVAYFQSLGVPLASIQAPFVARLEYWGGIALLFGLATRPVAFLLGSTMVVALGLADRVRFIEAWNPQAEHGPADVVAFVYLVLLLWLVFRGGGHISIDFGLSKLLGKRFSNQIERPDARN